MRERRQLNANGITMSCLLGGPSDGRPMVLLHGGGHDAHSWDPVWSGLAADHRVHAPELRGHGRSDRTPTYSVELFAADLTAVVTALGLSDVVLVGHSLGGTAALLAAQRAPGWLSALVLEEPMMLRPGLPPVALPARPADPRFDWDGVLPAMVAEINDPDPAWWDRLPDIVVPTLLLVGEDDPGPIRRPMIEAAALLPDVELVTVPVGHGIHHAAPERFLRAVTAFLGR